jgi:hypothetical protein
MPLLYFVSVSIIGYLGSVDSFLVFDYGLGDSFIHSLYDCSCFSSKVPFVGECRILARQVFGWISCF